MDPGGDEPGDDIDFSVQKLDVVSGVVTSPVHIRRLEQGFSFLPKIMYKTIIWFPAREGEANINHLFVFFEKSITEGIFPIKIFNSWITS